MRKFYLRPDVEAKRANRAKNDYRSCGHSDFLTRSAMVHVLNKIRQHDTEWCRERCPALADYMQRKIANVSAAYFLQREGRDFFDRAGSR